MVNWIREALLIRFDELSAQSEKISEVTVLKEQLHNLEKDLLTLSGTNSSVLSLIDLNTQLLSIQKEWLYMKGVQDGIKLRSFLLQSEEVQ
ncbi:hypothetical protein C8Z91_03855 [Paenibacillus elgii]|uniref:Uncharacterized protein n=1 Tax=Paenibacillus elgii TaxID=189691 RepID=A0A2T6G8X7_9BACL|nr:hypothetical protein [Paenibacillus elgii]PUA40604.1 hypothetical protein C8Z91_03855 [Paenibacillus elgii]